MVRDGKRRKRFTKNVSFEFRVNKERRVDGWGKLRREGWIEVNIKRRMVYEVKMEVYSRDEARHTGKSDL